MKKLYATAIVALIGMTNAYAEQVTLEIMGNISSMRDGNVSIQSSNALGYEVSVGQILTAYFTYDTTTALIRAPWGGSPEYQLNDKFSQSILFSNSNKPISLNLFNSLFAYELADHLSIWTVGYSEDHDGGFLTYNFELPSPYVPLNGYLPAADQWSRLAGTIEFSDSTSIGSFRAIADISSVRVLSAVPEPATYAMFAAGAFVLLASRRRRAS